VAFAHQLQILQGLLYTMTFNTLFDQQSTSMLCPEGELYTLSFLANYISILKW